MKTKQKKQLTLFDVRRRNQREQERKRNRSKFRKSLLRLASSRPTTSPTRMAMQMAAATVLGYMVARAQARVVTAVANYVLSKNKA